MTQTQAVKEILEKLGGVATLKEIYKHIHEIEDCQWGTKTPNATIRRIVQQTPDIIRMKPGYYMTKEYQNRLVVDQLIEQPHIHINIINGSGNNVIAHVDNNYTTPYQDKPLAQKRANIQVTPTIPDELNNPEVMRLLDIARNEGWLNEQYQPLVSRTKAAILANQIGQICSVEPRWRPFEKLWHREHLCKDYDKAQGQKSTGDIELEMKQKLE